MSNKKLIRYIKWFLSVAIIIATFGLFAWYITTKPEVLKVVFSLQLGTLILLCLGYTMTIAANAFVLYYSLRLLRKRVPLLENIILTGYSSIVNFFGPLQSGPGFRAVYLKRMHKVKIRDFLFVSIIFYGFFGLINGMVIGIISAIHFGQVALLLWVAAAIIILALGGWMLHTKYPDLISRMRIFMQRKDFWYIGLGALLLSAATVFTYYFELLTVHPDTSLFQTIVYTAAANLALFVSLTPGALGIRESFLVLSQQLHQIPSDAIVGASVIDRAFYVIFLLGMLLILLAMNVKKRLRVVETRKQ